MIVSRPLIKHCSDHVSMEHQQSSGLSHINKKYPNSLHMNIPQITLHIHLLKIQKSPIRSSIDSLFFQHLELGKSLFLLMKSWYVLCNVQTN